MLEKVKLNSIIDLFVFVTSEVKQKRKKMSAIISSTFLTGFLSYHIIANLRCYSGIINKYITL